MDIKFDNGRPYSLILQPQKVDSELVTLPKEDGKVHWKTRATGISHTAAYLWL